jgi:hypothetical protein
LGLPLLRGNAKQMEPQRLNAPARDSRDDFTLHVRIEPAGEHDASEYARSNYGTSQSGRARPRRRFCRARQRGSSNWSRTEQEGSRTLDERPSAFGRNARRNESFKESISPWETACGAGPGAGATALKLSLEVVSCAIQGRQASLAGWPRLPHSATSARDQSASRDHKALCRARPR